MQPEVDGPRSRPVPPGALQDGGEAGVQRLEAQHDVGTLVGVVARRVREVGLDPADFFVQTFKKNTKCKRCMSVNFPYFCEQNAKKSISFPIYSTWRGSLHRVKDGSARYRYWLSPSNLAVVCIAALESDAESKVSKKGSVFSFPSCSRQFSAQ